MRKILFFLMTIAFYCNVHAQSTIAKLKYEEAEEYYNKNEFQETLSKLEEVEKLLGAVNPKLLYLRIIAEQKLLDEDSSYLEPLKESCAYYLKAYDGNSNIEDKYKEVFKVSENLFQYERNDTFETGYKLFNEKNYEAALPYIQKAAAQGYARAFTLLGHMYKSGLGVTKDEITAANYYKRSAEKENAWGEYYLGQCYYFGWGVTQNYNEALNWFSLAAAKHLHIAMVAIADTYYNGFKNNTKAVEQYRKAVNSEDVYPMYMLGFLYYSGPTQDYAQAFNWFTKAAERGDSKAMNYLGVMYKSGKGVAIDKAKAYEWYIKAAEKGDYYAMGNLANMLENGDGIKRDKKAAREWREKQKLAKPY